MSEVAKPTILWDCFIFNGESEALQLRLHMLRDIVKQAGFSHLVHVLVESRMTFTGMAKPQMFYKNETLPHNVRVIEADLTGIDDAWEREYAQRNAIMQGLADARPSDIVMISDVDEIPNLNAIEQFAKRGKEAVTCLQAMYYYSWKWKLRKRWHGTVITTKDFLDTVSPQELRDKRKELYNIKSGGIHISYFGGIDEIKRKLVSFAHEEYAYVANDPKHIQKCISEGHDLFKRKEVQMDRSRRPNGVSKLSKTPKSKK